MNRKAEKLKAELESAIKRADKAKFQELWEIALTKYWYLTKKERSSYYMRFLEAMCNEKNRAK